MIKNRIVIIRHHPFSFEKPDAVKREKSLEYHILSSWGYAVSEINDSSVHFTPEDILIMYSNARWYPETIKKLLSMPNSNRPFVALWHYEPLPPSSASGLPMPWLDFREILMIVDRNRWVTDFYSNYFFLKKLSKRGVPDILFVSTTGRQEFLAEKGIQSYFVPFGYTPFAGDDLGLERDIDTLFLGFQDLSRRKKIFKYLRKQGVKLTTLGSWNSPDYFGDKRTLLLNRTKILLNIMRHDGEMSGMRLIFGMANKALNISEPIYKPTPYIPGKHYVSVEIKEMPAAIQYYLAHDDERQIIVEEAYSFVKNELTIENSWSQMMQKISERLESR
jgi:hypothetical protein